MNGFKCNITGPTSTVALAKPQLARRCGADPINGISDASPGNCTYGAKQPLYWLQLERNNVRISGFSFLVTETKIHVSLDVRGLLLAAILQRPLQLPGWRSERHIHRFIYRPAINWLRTYHRSHCNSDDRYHSGHGSVISLIANIYYVSESSSGSTQSRAIAQLVSHSL